ncbi:hypothetical protein [Mycobacterium dioxanotrophicus]|uniref:hypothetical protein n=1 Tax=Mycobacterium dioxanotrophicus TaxID=482462 RepID=UPI0018E03B0E|nr:hypothetical protein [Mycobacterium dioxanotrophicus]
MQIVPSHGTIEPSPFGLGIIGTAEPGAAGAVRWVGAAGAAGFALDDDVAGLVLVGACSVV